MAKIKVSDERMETVGCLFGHRGVPELLFEVPDRLIDRGKAFRIVRCLQCGLLFLSPRPTRAEIGRYYPFEAYWQEFAPAVRDETSWWRRWNRQYGLSKLRRFVEQAKAGGKLLDVGCGTGGFMAQMREHGSWEVYGLDTNRQAVEYARNRLQLKAYHGSLEDISYPCDTFDLVTLWNVLEHMHNPLQALREVWRVLRPDGILALSIPNGDSLDASLFGPCWVGLDPPRHLYTFSRRTLRQLLAQTGFEVLRLQHVSGSYHSFVTSLQVCIRHSRFTPSDSIRYALDSAVPSWAVHVLILPYLRLTEKTGKGAILSVLAKPI
jgi:2-polyprenyl-3-methyl-5-hydroxy-6-metoxy-1,4-benzoquinol methylase